MAYIWGEYCQWCGSGDHESDDCPTITTSKEDSAPSIWEGVLKTQNQLVGEKPVDPSSLPKIESQEEQELRMYIKERNKKNTSSDKKAPTKLKIMVGKKSTLQKLQVVRKAKKKKKKKKRKDKSKKEAKLEIHHLNH